MQRTDPLSFDLDRLDSYLTPRIKGFEGLHSAKKFPGGQSNPTFLILKVVIMCFAKNHPACYCHLRMQWIESTG